MFRITARTLLELGSELISSDIIAFYELIKNGFDAETKNGVTVSFDIVLPKNEYLRFSKRLEDGAEAAALRRAVERAMLPTASGNAREGFKDMIAPAKTPEKLAEALKKAQAQFNTITIDDTGNGMSMAELLDNFLVIGTASRKRAVEEAVRKGLKKSPYLGEKGIGRLSAMRLGERLRVETARTDDALLNLLEIDWRDFNDLDKMLDQIPIKSSLGGPKPSSAWSGTSIIISDLSGHWTGERVREMAESAFCKLTDPYENAGSRPRIALKWNGERLNIPLMPRALLEACHAKIKGEYSIDDGEPKLICDVEALDLGFDHPRKCEVITMTLNDMRGTIIGKAREIDEEALVGIGPFSFEAYWYNRRRLGELDAIGNRLTVLAAQKQWSGILLFRDGFRVFPYGDEDDDWLSLDRKAMGRSGYTMNKMQFLGRVSIKRTANPSLLDQTNREGLRVTNEQRVLLEVLRYGVQDCLGNFMKKIKPRDKIHKNDLAEAHVNIQVLENRANSAVQGLKRLAPGEDAVNELQEVLREFAGLAKMAHERIAQVEQENRQMIDMAGVGLMVEVVAHELARASENALKTLEELKSCDIPSDLRPHFTTLHADMKSLSKRIRILDQMSVAGRQRAETFLLDELVLDIMNAHQAQFTRHKVNISLDHEKRPLRIRAVKGMIVQIIENLISNSIYWMDIRAFREPRYQPEISIRLLGGPPTLIFEDNGTGIAPANREQVFTMFFSLKESSKRRGLGLFIARDAAQYQGGSLILDEEPNPQTGRLHRFILKLPQGTQA